MSTQAGKRKINWWLVLAGALLLLFGITACGAPWLFLEFLTIWAGIGFMLSGVASIASYFQRKGTGTTSGWDLFMGILDIVLGILFIAHPFWFVDFIPWLLGIAFVVFGLLEIMGTIPFAQLVPESRAIMVMGGALSIIAGLLFIFQPASLSIWIAVFAIIRGVTLIAMGFTARA